MEAQNFVNLNFQFNLRNPKGKKPSIIYAVIAYNKKQYKISTGVKVYPTHWNAKKQVAIIGGGLAKVDNQNNLIANEKIREIIRNAEQMKLYLCDSQVELDIKNFFDTIKKHINPNIKSKSKTKIMAKKVLIENPTLIMKKANRGNKNSKESTKLIYDGHVNSFKEFLKLKKIKDSWENINLKTLEEWQEHLFKEEKTIGTINLMIATIKKCCKEIWEIKDVWKYNDSNIERVKKIKSKLSKAEILNQEIALTEEQVFQLYNFSDLDEKEKEIRDIFVLQSLVGQRISDMGKITDGSITYNGDTISISQQKGSACATIPLFDISKILIDKYKNGSKFYNTDIRYHQKIINDKIKNIAEKAGLTEMTRYKEEKGMKIIEINKRMCDRIHTHTARHSFITIMCRLGVAKEDIMMATGHESDKMINNVYAHLTELDKKNKVKKAFGNLNSSVFSMSSQQDTKQQVQQQVQPQQQVQQQVQPQQNNIFLLQEMKNIGKKEHDNELIREAKEVLIMMQVDPFVITETNDREMLWRMVMNVERELLDFGIDYKIVKEIFNENKTLRERADILHQIYMEAKAIKEAQ